MAVLRLTRAVLPAMIARGRGTIITVSTGAIFSPQPDYYVATKTFGEAFMRALAEEVRDTGVRLQALCPGFTRTEFFDRAGATTDHLPASVWMSAEDVVQASLAGLELGEIVCLPFVKDASLLARLREHQHVLLYEGLIGTLAQRYATHES